MDLIGQGHQDLVAFMVQRFEQIRRSETVARVVVFEAESGAGKSRVVREVYERLRTDPSLQRMNAGGQGYWPELPSDWVEGPRRSGGLPQRKRLGPSLADFARPEGVLPGFCWLPVDCDQAPDGSLVPALELLRPAIKAHARFLAEAWQQASSTPEGLARWGKENLQKEFRDLAGEGGIEGLGQWLGSLGLPVPLLGFGVVVAGRIVKGSHERGRTKADIAAGGGLDREDKAAAELFAQLMRLVHRDLPLVLVVEDIHMMDAHFADLLELMADAQPGKPVLVIGTAWPEGRTRPVYRDWLERLGADDEAGLVEVVGRGGRIPFPRLDVGDRSVLARCFAPNTDQERIVTIAQRWSNPYALVLTMTGQLIQGSIENGRLTIANEDLAKMPADIRGIYQVRWDELEPHVRDALAIAAGALPPSDDEPVVRPFIQEIVAQAAFDAGLLEDPHAMVAALGLAVEPLEWVRLSDENLDLVKFREWVLQLVAYDAWTQDFSSAQRHALSHAVVRALTAWIHQRRGDRYTIDPSDRIAVVVSRWLLALEPKVPGDEALACAVAAVTLAGAAARARQFRTAIGFLTQPGRLDALPPDHPDTLDTRKHLAALLGGSGRVEEAVQQLEQLRDRQVRVLGVGHRATVATCGSLAELLGRSGRVEEAVKQLEQLREDHVRVRHPLKQDTLAIHNNFIQMLARSGRLDEAVQELEQLRDYLVRRKSPAHRDTVATRRSLADCLERAGRVQEAVKELERLRDDQVRVRGRHNWNTVATRESLARLLGRSGRVDDAVAELEKLFEDRVRRWGPTHRQTMATRISLAGLLDRAGRLDEAVAQLEQLRDDQTRALGPVHRDTKATRSLLADLLRRAGRFDDAVAQLEQLRDDQVQALGLDHRDAIRAKGGLADLMESSGRVDDAVAQLEQLQDDQVRVLGPVHRDSLATRARLADLLGPSRSADDTVAQLEQLRDDHVRVLGPIHRETLATRSRLADILGRAGRVEEAVKELVELRDDQVRLRGPDHRRALRARSRLAALLESSGRIPEAVIQLEQLLDDQMRALGLIHRETLATRRNLARLLELNGRAEESVAQVEQLLDNQAQVLGPDHQDTIATRASLAQLLVRSGRVEDALMQIKQLHDDRVRDQVLSDLRQRLRPRREVTHILARSGSLEETVALLEHLLNGALRLLGPDHLDTLFTRSHLARALRSSGQSDAAFAQFEQLGEDQVRVLGADHSDTLRTRRNLADLLGAAGVSG